MLPLRAILAGMSILAVTSAGADTLCGRSFDSFDRLYADLDAEPGHQIRGGSPNDAMFVDALGVAWRLTKAPHPAMPAVGCIRPVRSGERVGVEVQIWCRSPDRAACQTFFAGWDTAEWK
jgi:hypothetical protein